MYEFINIRTLENQIFPFKQIMKTLLFFILGCLSKEKQIKELGKAIYKIGRHDNTIIP